MGSNPTKVDERRRKKVSASSGGAEEYDYGCGISLEAEEDETTRRQKKKEAKMDDKTFSRTMRRKGACSVYQMREMISSYNGKVGEEFSMTPPCSTPLPLIQNPNVPTGGPARGPAPHMMYGPAGAQRQPSPQAVPQQAMMHGRPNPPMPNGHCNTKNPYQSPPNANGHRPPNGGPVRPPGQRPGSGVSPASIGSRSSGDRRAGFAYRRIPLPQPDIYGPRLPRIVKPNSEYTFNMSLAHAPWVDSPRDDGGGTAPRRRLMRAEPQKKGSKKEDKKAAAHRRKKT
ncbi:hypothetical protein STCU_10040 [Strigomonas culicis]|uniref:Uncharacterized protein n=1 Tax=Strigomonas culicis TaxID=28005 RepID=S9V604_9TRYP|nr:hypothetical protein STCU_10040 [Strigomonas culicis]|eukprot:EPY18340.1 hypothetical protein STCU_10040 [Strigomonas culicis]